MSRPRIAQLVFAIVFCALPAWAADVGVAGTRLVLEEDVRGQRSVELVVRDEDGITKGPGAGRGADPGLSARLEVFYTDDSSALHGVWEAPAPWQANRREVARFANPAAPDGVTSLRRIVVREGRSLRVSAFDFGDGETIADLAAGAPSAEGGIMVVFTLQNDVDGSTHRLCTRFAEADGSVVELRASARGRRLVARRGVPAACPIDIELTSPPECEILNQVECLLPFPSSRFLVPAPTATGVRVSLPQVGMPKVNGPALPASLLDGLDGFSPGVQILMHFPQGVSPVLTDAARLLPPSCCGQPAGPPWIDTRTYDARSLDVDSPSVLLDADTGERLVHFIEPDARAAAGSGRQATFLRPGRLLTPGHRYIVAMRNLVAPNGAAVVAEPVFAALRDGVITSTPAIEERRASMEEVLDILEENGVARDDLVLAFDFIVRSEEQLTGDILAMRDAAFAWLAAVEADPAALNFQVTSVSDGTCTGNQTLWRSIKGTYDVPLFLTGDLTDSTTPVIARDPSGVPVQTGITRADFDVNVPCSVRGSPGGAFPSVSGAFTAASSPTGAFPVLMGHGLFQRGSFIVGAIPNIFASRGGWKGITFGTDWRGLSGQDVGWVGTRIIGAGTSQLHNFPAFPARLHQGVVNTLVLARMAKRGLFNRHQAFRRADGSALLPGPATEMGYWGISLGGIMGTYIAALTPDIKGFALDVPGANFSCMLQRANPFRSFDALLNGIGLTDPMLQALGIGLVHELWASVDPVAVASHVTEDRLPGAGDPGRVLYLPAWLDQQVSNTCTEIAARTMGMVNLPGSIQHDLVQIPTASGPTNAAMVTWHLGEIDILNPAQQFAVPPLANLFPNDRCDPHPRRFSSAASIRQIVGAINPGGAIVDTCTGLCDGVEADEKPLSGCVP